MKTNSKEFQDLKKTWYDKLKAEGFKDIEYSEDALKNYAGSRFLSTSGRSIEEQRNFNEAKETYYTWAGRFFYDYEFSCEREKIIWNMHKEGHGVTKISAALKARGYCLGRDSVNDTVLRLSQIMRKKYYDEG